MDKVSAFIEVRATESKTTVVKVTVDEKGKEHEEKLAQKHYQLPEIPNMQLDVIGRNPKEPNKDQVWLVIAPVPVLHALDLEKDVKWLGVEEAGKLLKKWGFSKDLAAQLADGRQPALVEP